MLRRMKMRHTREELNAWTKDELMDAVETLETDIAPLLTLKRRIRSIIKRARIDDGLRSFLRAVNDIECLVVENPDDNHNRQVLANEPQKVIVEMYDGEPFVTSCPDGVIVEILVVGESEPEDPPNLLT